KVCVYKFMELDILNLIGVKFPSDVALLCGAVARGQWGELFHYGNAGHSTSPFLAFSSARNISSLYMATICSRSNGLSHSCTVLWSISRRTQSAGGASST